MNTNPNIKTVATTKLPLPLWEFVLMMAGLLALNALAIDTMIPALSQIGEFYQTPSENDQQLIIFAYIFGLRVLLACLRKRFLHYWHFVSYKGSLRLAFVSSPHQLCET